MAEALFMHKVRAAGLQDKIEADSAGTGYWHLGEQPHSGTRKLLQRNDIAYTHQARQITRRDLERFDYIITMDEENLADVRALGPTRATVRSLMEYAPHTGYAEVPDPYYTGGFDEVYELVDAATEGLLDSICKEHGLVRQHKQP
jgi:protein-tyrosine phosphatase